MEGSQGKENYMRCPIDSMLQENKKEATPHGVASLRMTPETVPKWGYELVKVYQPPKTIHKIKMLPINMGFTCVLLTA